MLTFCKYENVACHAVMRVWCQIFLQSYYLSPRNLPLYINSQASYKEHLIYFSKIPNVHHEISRYISHGIAPSLWFFFFFPIQLPLTLMFFYFIEKTKLHKDSIPNMYYHEPLQAAPTTFHFFFFFESKNYIYIVFRYEHV